MGVYSYDPAEDEKVQEVEQAIDELFSDTSVPKVDTKQRMLYLRDQININLDALEDV